MGRVCTLGDRAGRRCSPAGAFTPISATIPVAAPANAKFEDLEEGHTEEQKAAIAKKLYQRSWTSSSSQRAAHDQQAEQLMQDKGSGGTQVMG